MQTRIVLLVLLITLGTSCTGVECGNGTTERDGACVASDETIGDAKCGPMTELRGTQCVPLKPTVCDPDTTMPHTDANGVTTCIGTGGGCSSKLACPTASGGKHTVCGQLYDFETGALFANADATGAQCTAAAASGPCAVGIRAYDAAGFANGNMTTLTTDPVYIDDCGRYRVAEIALPTSGIIALGLDDATIGPGGITNASGVATTPIPGSTSTPTRDLDAFIVRNATTTAWAQSGGPTIASGYFVPVYRGHRTGSDLAPNVTVSYAPMSPPQAPTLTDTNRDFYFAADASARTTLSPGAVTGVNGTALFTGANLTEVYSGVGGLPSTCRWEIHGGASTAGVVFIQVFRPTDAPGMTCSL